jgi:hypothetical protein
MFKHGCYFLLVLALAFMTVSGGNAKAWAPFYTDSSSLNALRDPLPDGLNTSAAINSTNGPIIVDHTVVDQYDDIPQEYIDLVKTMWLNVPGESHSSGYRKGLQLLEDLDSRFQVNITETGTPEAYTDQHLRVSRALRTQYNSWAYGTGEQVWYTNITGTIQVKNHLTYANTHDLAIAAMGFGWCWDMTWHNGPGGTIDPVYQVRWAGSSVGGPDGDLRWGLDTGDVALTGNHVTMDTYLNATQEYMTYAQTNGYPTKVFFTTGPVDGYSGESGYQRQIKHEYIRDYVLASSDRILFDYADILSWSDADQQNLQSWTDYGGVPRQYQMIHADNMLDLDGTYTEDGDHIGQRGALRLGKALWWMLARLAGWDGTPATALTLHGMPGDQTIHLTWNVNMTLPNTSTWQITYYYSQTVPITLDNIPNPTRAYTLTNLTNYLWYTVTLNAVVDSTPILTRSIHLMPTDQLVYLPLIRRDETTQLR